jgi:hypothetical protein
MFDLIWYILIGLISGVIAKLVFFPTNPTRTVSRKINRLAGPNL